jgi:hypothetical protein
MIQKISNKRKRILCAFLFCPSSQAFIALKPELTAINPLPPPPPQPPFRISTEKGKIGIQYVWFACSVNLKTGKAAYMVSVMFASGYSGSV